MLHSAQAGALVVRAAAARGAAPRRRGCAAQLAPT